MMTVTLSVQLEQHFLHIAEESKQSANQVIQQALADFAEDYLDARIGEAAIERLQRGESEIISLEEVERMLDEMDD
jgi:predicted DNA-binding protein